MLKFGGGVFDHAAVQSGTKQGDPISPVLFVLILSSIVGLFAGLAAVTLKTFVHLISHLLLDILKFLDFPL